MIYDSNFVGDLYNYIILRHIFKSIHFNSNFLERHYGSARQAHNIPFPDFPNMFCNFKLNFYFFPSLKAFCVAFLFFF